MLLGHDNLDQQLANLTDDELVDLGVDERQQLLDWLNDSSQRAQSTVNQDQMLRLLNTTPETDARKMIEALRADDALLTKKMLSYMDWQHKRQLHASLQLLYNTTMFNGFTIDDLKVSPVIPMKPKGTSLLDTLDLDQLEIMPDGKVHILPKRDPFGRDAPFDLKLDPFAPFKTQTPEWLGTDQFQVGPSISLFGLDDPKLRGLMPRQQLPFIDLFPYKKPSWPIFGKKDALTDFIQGPVPSEPIVPLSKEGEQRLGRIRKEIDSWSTSGSKIGDEFKAASPLERQLLAGRLGDEGMTKLFDSIDSMDAVIIGSLGPLREGQTKLTERREELMAEVSGWQPRQRTAIYMWMLGTMSNDEVRSLLSKLTEDRWLNKTIKPIPGMKEYLSKRGIDLDNYKQPGGVAGAALGTWRWAKKVPGSIIRDSTTEELIDSMRIGRIPEPFQTMIRDEAKGDAESLMTPGRIAQGGFSYLTLGFSDIPFGLYSAGESLISGSIDIAKGDTTEGAEKIAPAAAMIVMALIGRGKVGPATAELSTAELAALEEEGLLGPKGPGQFSLKGYKGPLSPAASRVEGVLKANPNLAAASGALVDELGGLANVEKAAEYLQNSSAATRMVIKRGVPGLKALVAAEGDVVAAEAMLDTTVKTPKLLPAPKGPPPPPRPGMSTGELAEQAALDQARPGSFLVPDKTAGFDGMKGGSMQITNVTTRVVKRNGVKVTETVLHITTEGGEAIQIKTTTGLGKLPIADQVIENVSKAVDKADLAKQGKLDIKASPQPLPGQPTVFPKVTVKNPNSITIVVQVPITVEYSELMSAWRAAEAWVKNSPVAKTLPRIDIVVQYER